MIVVKNSLIIPGTENGGGAKLMGLAPYGEPKYVDTILENFIQINSDGSFILNMEYFNYCTGLNMTNEKFSILFDGPPRKPESPLTQREMDMACSVQIVTEEVILKMSHKVHKETNQKNLCLAGGVALNCVANGKLLREGPFEDIWIQPAAGDAGGALGAALYVWYHYFDNARVASNEEVGQQGSYFGPAYSDNDIKMFLEKKSIIAEKYSEDEIVTKTAKLIANHQVVGWFQGRMEFGPRALGNRSIIGDARSSKMQEVMNLKIKFRESFRPFAPSVIEERISDYFQIDRPSPFMLLVADIHEDLKIKLNDREKKLSGLKKLGIVRSKLPAITHIDYSARIQSVSKKHNPMYYTLIKKLEEFEDCAVIINTSFNVRGEPIVCTPEDAYICFMRTNMDYLIFGNYILAKKDQPEFIDKSEWEKEFELD